MKSLLNFEFGCLPPSVNKMYCHTRKGGLYIHPGVLAFKNNITNILKELTFIRSNKRIKFYYYFLYEIL